MTKMELNFQDCYTIASYDFYLDPEKETTVKSFFLKMKIIPFVVKCETIVKTIFDWSTSEVNQLYVFWLVNTSNILNGIEMFLSTERGSVLQESIT